MKEQQLKRLYHDYLKAFAQADLTLVQSCYQLPCVLSTPEKVVLLNSSNEFDKEFNAIFAMLKDNKISAFKANNACYQLVDEHLALVAIDWQFFDDANNLFTEFSAIYHLSYQQNHFKIVNVISHDTRNLSLTHPLNLSNEEK